VNVPAVMSDHTMFGNIYFTLFSLHAHLETHILKSGLGLQYATEKKHPYNGRCSSHGKKTT